MRAIVLGAALAALLAGCVTYERRPYVSPPGAPADAPPLGPLSEQQVLSIAFRLCHDRALRVDRVERARVDAAGRWHVLLAGFSDRAQLLLDGRDGTLLKGRFYREDSAPPGASPSQTAPTAPQEPQNPPPPEWPELE